MKKIIVLTLLIFFLHLTIFSIGQSVPGIFSGNAFEELSKKRVESSNKILKLQNQIDLINDDDTINLVRERTYNEYSIQYFEKQINLIKKLDTIKLKDSINALKSNIEFYKSQNESLKYKLIDATKSYELKLSLRKQLDDTKSELTQVEYQINQLMIPKISQQNFLFWSSIFFVLLMGILLFTFYFVVRRDSRVRIAIFGSDSGLQFVTLFSIIIAIILFGLTNILEGKELSALLGSIAGYILGKVDFTSKKNDTIENQHPQETLAK